MVSINQILSTLGSYFLSPVGLLALLGVIPLVLFYLIKRKPEKEIMPSMMFFMKDKREGKASKAFRKLQRNNLLLLHILIISLLAVAMAQPFLETEESSENAVIILDRSASMANQMDNAKDFIEENKGSSNTLILADSSTEVLAEDSSSTQVSSHINDVEPTHLPGDPARALELASMYDGDMVVASDLQHSQGQRPPEEVVEDLRNDGRDVQIFEPEPDNSWGIVDVDPGEEESSLDIMNFEDTEREITIEKDGEEAVQSVEPGAVETVTFSTSPGENVLSLDSDGFAPDNTAYISVPEREVYDVLFISDEENPYLETAFDLIDFVEMETESPPLDNDMDADIYMVGETENILSETVNEIEEQVEEGASLVVFGHETVFDTGFDSLPVESSYDIKETPVEIYEPHITSFETTILDTNKTDGESYAEPEESLVKAGYGDGEVFFYNINDKDFRNRLNYPLMWQTVLRDLVDQPSLEELNLQTGDEIDHSSIETASGDEEEGLTELTETGFYEADDRVYAANLESIDESDYQEPSIEAETGDEEMTEEEVQNLVILLIGLLILGEIIYLRYIGEI